MADSNRPSGLPADVGAYLGTGTKINGKLHFEGQATIDGEVEGEIVAQSHVTVGQQAIVKGKVTAQSIMVQGKVMADVIAEKKLEIQPPGSVVGDVTTQSLVIGDGAMVARPERILEQRIGVDRPVQPVARLIRAHARARIANPLGRRQVLVLTPVVEAKAFGQPLHR